MILTANHFRHLPCTEIWKHVISNDILQRLATCAPIYCIYRMTSAVIKLRGTVYGCKRGGVYMAGGSPDQAVGCAGHDLECAAFNEPFLHQF